MALSEDEMLNWYITVELVWGIVQQDDYWRTVDSDPVIDFCKARLKEKRRPARFIDGVRVVRQLLNDYRMEQIL